MGFLGVLPIQPPAPLDMMSHALARLGDFDRIYDNYRRSEPPLASPAGNDQLGVANLPDDSVFHPPQEEPAVNPVPLWGLPLQDPGQHGNRGGGLNDINYNDFVDAFDDFNRDDFMDILNGMREEEARAVGRGRGSVWDF